MFNVIATRRARKVVAAGFTTALLAGILPAAASAGCPSNPTSNVFAQFNDNAAYVLVQGGNFESGAPGWSLTKAAVVEEAGSPSGDRHALAIQPGGVAVSPAFCVSSEYPTFRFLVHQISGGGTLNVSLRWTDAWGWTHNNLVSSLQAGTSWSLSPVLKLASELPLWMPGSTINARLVFEPAQGSFFERNRSSGAWAVDGVYVDPHSR
jgi:hypothetical protein